jgi:2-aminoadipate transaminase
MLWLMGLAPILRHDSDIPLYRQLFEQIAGEIRVGRMTQGDRLPPTRELAGQLGLNRTTVSAAYELLEAEGLIAGQVGRGSFVRSAARAENAVDWRPLLDRGDARAASQGLSDGDGISFVMSRPSRDLFPLDDFRASCEAVLDRGDLAGILQLGSPAGYEPLRRYLLEEARAQNLAGPGDDLVVTNGCQQAVDLIARVLLRAGDAVILEDPVYPGIRNLLSSMGARLVGIPVGPDGMDIAQLERAIERERPRFLMVTPNFQNPTGATLPAAARRQLIEIARAAGIPIIENDAYGELRYFGDDLPAIKQLDTRGGTALLRSFSKVSFPGLRVGWAIGPKALLDRIRQAKESSDLHTDQLSQAVLLEFAKSGRLADHRARVLSAGAERLQATLEACRSELPAGTLWTRPEGGMNVWVRLPEACDASQLLAPAREAGVTYLPGRAFAVARQEASTLRLSFAGLEPEQIRQGLKILGKVVSSELETAGRRAEPHPAMV